MQIESLTLQQITSFCRVYECGGYAVAAQDLGLAGPTIWEQVRTLERIYQVKLFIRSGRNITPTASGTTLYQMLRPLLAGIASTFDRLAEASDLADAPLRIATGVRMMLEELGAPLKRFQKSHPKVRMRIRNADNMTAQKWILDDQVDVAFLLEPPREFLDDEIQYESLYPLEYMVALPPRHRLSNQSSIRLAELIDEPLIIGSADTIACVRAGLGIGMIAARTGGHLTSTVKTRSIADEVGRVHVVAAYRKGRLLTNALQTLLESIRLGCNRRSAA